MIVLVLFMGVADLLYAQRSAIRFERQDALQLTQNTVNAILQDRYGFMWFGTEQGLHRFDGATTLTFMHDASDSTSISDNWITSIAEDDAGNLWIGTRHAGLNRFERHTRTFSRYPYAVQDPSLGLTSAAVSSLLWDAEGYLWIGTGGGGLSRLDARRALFEHFPAGDRHGPVSDHIWSLFEDRQGNIWVGSWASGLSRYVREEGLFEHFRHREGDNESLSSDRIRSITEDRHGRIFVGTSGGGVNQFEEETGRFQRYTHSANDPRSISHNVVWQVHADSRGTLWAGTYGGGLSWMERGNGEFARLIYDQENPSTALGLISNVILSVYEDQSGLLWLGTDAGVFVANPNHERIRVFRYQVDIPNSLSHSDVLSIHESRRQPGSIWVGTNRGGLNLGNLSTNAFTTFKNQTGLLTTLGSDVVSSIDEDADGILWVGTKGGGLNRFDPQTGIFRRYRHDPADSNSLSHDVVVSVRIDRNGTIWAGTDGGGLNRLDPATNTFRRYQNISSDGGMIGYGAMVALHEDPDGNIWFGTGDAGLARLDPRTDAIAYYEPEDKQPESLAINRTHDFHSDTQGILWIATYGGLIRYDPASHLFQRYTEKEGLAGNVVNSVTSDEDGILWITTTHGIARFDPETETFLHYRLGQGLLGRRFNPGAMARLGSGEIAVGGSDGLYVFHPEALVQEEYRSPLVVTSFKKHGRSILSDLLEGSRVSLSYNDSYFSFEFALLEYGNPHAHVFRYRLDGMDSNWHETSGAFGQANYSNLDGRAGTFLLRIEGRDSRGRISTVSIPVFISPPWWRTTWFRALTVFSMLFLFGGSVYYGHRKRERLQAERFRVMSESREQERHHFARELHDVPLQNLYSIRHKLEVLLRSAPQQVEEGQVTDLQGMLEDTTEDLRRICGELRPPTLGPFGLAKALRAHLRTFEQLHPHLIVEFELEPDGLRLSEDLRLALFRIYQECLNNVARHAQATRVWVRFRMTEEEAHLEIEDDGKGFRVPRDFLELAREKHYGLAGVAERAQAAKGSLDILSAPSEGTRLIVRIPLLARRNLGPLDSALLWIQSLRRVQRQNATS